METPSTRMCFEMSDESYTIHISLGLKHIMIKTSHHWNK